MYTGDTLLKSKLLFKVYLIDGDSVVRRTGGRHCLALIYHVSFEPQIFPVLLNILSQRSNEEPKADKRGQLHQQKASFNEELIAKVQ